MNPIMLVLTFTALIIALAGLALQTIRQPLVVGCVTIGITIKPFGLVLTSNRKTMLRIGGTGILLLLVAVSFLNSSSMKSGTSLAVIALTLIISPFRIEVLKRFTAQHQRTDSFKMNVH